LHNQRLRGAGLNEPAVAKKENGQAQKNNKPIHSYILDICICDCSPYSAIIKTKEITPIKKILFFFSFYPESYVFKLSDPAW